MGIAIVQGLCRADGSKSRVHLSFSFGVLGHLAKVAHAQLCVACPRRERATWVGASHCNVDKESYHSVSGTL